MKTYIAPQVEVTEVEGRSTIMSASSASMPTINNAVDFGADGIDFAAPDHRDWFDFE